MFCKTIMLIRRLFYASVMARRVIKIYTIDGKPVSVHPTGRELELKGTLGDFVVENWKGKENWDNAWIPLVSEMKTESGVVVIEAGAISYRQTNGILRAIDEIL